jgi:hypothetical protein
MNNIEKGDILVATWGATMTLTTWVRVVKVSPKTLLVEEIQDRALNEGERKEKKLSEGYLTCYKVPSLPIKTTLNNGEPKAQFRLYQRGKMLNSDNEADREYARNTWHGYPDNFGIRLFFHPWDGTPQYENHCD